VNHLSHRFQEMLITQLRPRVVARDNPRSLVMYASNSACQNDKALCGLEK